MKKNIFSLFAVIAVAALTLCLVGCNQPKDLTLSTLEGKWVSSYGEEYTITPDTFDAGSNSYAGEELEIVEDEETEGSGIIFIKYTRSYESTITDPNDSTWTKSEYWMNKAYDMKFVDPKDSSYTKYTSWYRYSTTAPDVGKWYAVHYQNLTSESVELAGAYGKVSSTTSLEEAKSEFTIANGYFTSHSECKKAE